MNKSTKTFVYLTMFFILHLGILNAFETRTTKVLSDGVVYKVLVDVDNGDQLKTDDLPRKVEYEHAQTDDSIRGEEIFETPGSVVTITVFLHTNKDDSKEFFVWLKDPSWAGDSKEGTETVQSTPSVYRYAHYHSSPKRKWSLEDPSVMQLQPEGDRSAIYNQNAHLIFSKMKKNFDPFSDSYGATILLKASKSGYTKISLGVVQTPGLPSSYREFLKNNPAMMRMYCFIYPDLCYLKAHDILVQSADDKKGDLNHVRWRFGISKNDGHLILGLKKVEECCHMNAFQGNVRSFEIYDLQADGPASYKNSPVPYRVGYEEGTNISFYELIDAWNQMDKSTPEIEWR